MQPIITKEQFCKYMADLENFIEEKHKASEALDAFCDGLPVVKIGDGLSKSYIDILEIIMNDDIETISWWIYDLKDNSDKIITYSYKDENGNKKEKEYLLDTYEKLYDYFVEENFNENHREILTDTQPMIALKNIFNL